MNLTQRLPRWLAALGLALVGLSAQAKEIKVALDTPPDLEKSGTYVWANAFSKHLNANGLTAKEYQRGALGEEAERLDQISQGLLQVSMSDLKSAAGLDSSMYGVTLPYLFKDAAHLDKALVEGGLLAQANERLAKKGVRIMGVVHLGLPAGIFNTKKPVTSVADMSSLRMRALDKRQIQLFAAWGTTGTVISWAEVPNALQTGIADGYLNPPIVPLMFGHTGFIKHFTDARISPSIRLALASSDWYASLNAAQRKTVDEAASKATQANRDWINTRTMEFQMLEKAGIKVITLSDAARAEFQKRSQALYASDIMTADQVAAWVKAAGL
jgi:TRAP-type C4-dicarboxylate transport system substrate-binding protein